MGETRKMLYMPRLQRSLRILENHPDWDHRDLLVYYKYSPLRKHTPTVRELITHVTIFRHMRRRGAGH